MRVRCQEIVYYHDDADLLLVTPIDLNDVEHGELVVLIRSGEALIGRVYLLTRMFRFLPAIANMDPFYFDSASQYHIARIVKVVWNGIEGWPYD